MGTRALFKTAHVEIELKLMAVMVQSFTKAGFLPCVRKAQEVVVGKQAHIYTALVIFMNNNRIMYYLAPFHIFLLRR